MLALSLTAGRGGNRWESPDGCLMFSACTRLAIPGQRLPFVQYVVSLAVVQAVQAEAAARLQVLMLPLPAVLAPCRGACSAAWLLHERPAHRFMPRSPVSCRAPP